jgi:hypothetical protein
LGRGAPRSDDWGGPIEAVKTSQASGDKMFMNAVPGARTHLRCPRVRARLRRGGKRTRRLRAAIDDLCEEGLDKELTRGRSTMRMGAPQRGHGHERVSVDQQTVR